MSLFDLEFVIKGTMLISSIASAVIGGLIYMQGYRKHTTLVFFGISISLAFFFLFATYFHFGYAGVFNWFLLFAMYALLATAVLLSLKFTLILRIRQKYLSLTKTLLITLPFAVLLGLLLMQQNRFVAPIVDAPESLGGLDVLYFGPLFPLYLIVFSGYTIATFVYTARNYRHSAGIFKSQIYTMSLGLILLLITIYIGIIVAPTQGYYHGYLIAPPLTIFLLLTIAYGLARYNQWNIKYLGTQLFTILIVIVLMFEVLGSQTVIDQVINGLVLLSVTLSSYYLLRSVKEEVESTAHMEQLVKDLAAVNQDLKTLDDRKSEFVIMAAHHLKGPLTLIKGYASMLLEGLYGKRINNNARAAIQKIFDSSNRLIDIIGDFMDISNIESGEMDYEFEVTDLGKLVLEVIEEVKPNINASTLSFSEHIDENEKYLANIDKGKLRQVVSNLIDNALKYTLEGSVSVSLKKMHSGKVIRITIADTGVGMSEETLDKLFKKFSRAKGISRLHTGGSGLGLYVARQILQNHNGRIWAESDGEGKGSQFHVEVNAVQALSEPLK